MMFLCEAPMIDIPYPECVVNDILSLISLTFTILIVFQIIIRIKIYKVPFNNSTFLFYLILLQTGFYNIYNIFYPFLQIYLLEIYLRHIVFLYVTYFFSKKALKFKHKPSHLTFTRFIAFLLLCYFTGVLFYSLFKKSIGLLCKDVIWIYVRVSGILLCFICSFVAYGLAKKLEKSMGEYKHMNSFYKNATLQSMSTVVYEKIKATLESLWKIVLFLALSQFLSFCVYLYFIFNTESTCDLLIPDDEHPNCQKIKILNLIVLTITKVICYFVPIIVTMRTFWKPFKNKVNNEMEDDENFEGYYGNLMYENSGFQGKRSTSSTSSIYENIGKGLN